MIRASAAAAFAALFLACGTSSPAPSKCATGQSVCLPPGGGTAFCADIGSDPKNCGACNLACPAVTGSTSVACHAGECVADCGGGFGSTTKVVCGGKVSGDGGITAYCTDTATDHENCGACGTVCNGTQQCQAGKCTSVPGTAACGGSGTGTTYVDLRSDRANCGTCGNACAANETCSGGACNPCPVAQCGNVCVDTQHDPKNCGTCGNVVANCENGVGLSKITIDRTTAPFNPAVVGAPGNYPVSVKVHSQLRVVRVSVTVAGTTVTDLALQGPPEADPTIWSGTITVPGTSTVALVFDAYDELYQPRAADAGIVDTVHSDEQSVTATVLPAPTAAATPATPTVQAQTPTPVPVGPVFKWIPLNGPALQFTVSVPINQNIASVQLLENNRPFGTAKVNGSGTATFSALPAQVGVGDLSVVACPIDLAGQRGPCSPAIAFTVGRIAPLQSPAVIGRNNDGSGSHTIYYVAQNQQLFQQDFAQLNSTAIDEPGALVGAASYYGDGLRPVPEGTGVYAIKADGTGVDRVDGPTLLKTNFVTPPAGVQLRGLDAVTPAALALCDTAAAPNAGSYFAPASPTQTSAPAVKAGILVGVTNVSRANELCPLPPVPNAFPNSGSPPLQVTSAGAVVGWFNNAGDIRPLLFHPAITTATHVLPLMTSAPATLSVRDLQVFPGGEIVFQYVDTSSGTSFLGAAYFDGQSQPLLLPPIQLGAAGGGALAHDFLVVKPGLILGAVPASSAGAGQQAIEIQAKGAALQVFQPAPSNGTTAGPLQSNGVASRLGGSTTFAISDDGTKALFVTTDQVAGAPDVVLRLHLLDLATGTDTPFGGSPNGSFTHLPEFVHSAPVYSGAAPAGAHQYVVWTEALRTAPGQTTSHERIAFANFQGAVSTVDRLNPFAAADSLTSSAAAGAIFFLSESDQGGADLYTVPLTAGPGPVVATRVIDRVFWFKLREDKRRLLVARSDGTILFAPLAPATDVSKTLVPLVNAGFLGDAPILHGDGIGSFGFTPDGDHAWVQRDAYTSLSNNIQTGLVETIDFTTGAFARTDFGRVASGSLNGEFQPMIGFVGGAATAVLLDQVSVEATKARMAVAPPASPTSRVDTGALPAGYQFGNDAGNFYSSVDYQEGLLQHRQAAFAPSTGPAARFNQGVAVRLQKDGTFDTFFSASNSGLQQAATYSPFGGPYLPDWSVFTDFDGTQNSRFKVWGGATPKPFIMVSRNFAAQSDPQGTVITPDFQELMFSFNDGNAVNGYAMALPLPGHTPPAPPLP